MFEEALRLLGYGLCHQLPERSFFGGGLQVPVCARDTGIYLGFMIALIVLSLIHRRERPSEAPPWRISLVLVLFVVAMAIDGFTSYAGLRVTTNGIRLLTGYMTGFALAAFTVSLLNGQLWTNPGPGRVLDSWRRLGQFVAGMLATCALIYWGGSLLGVLYPALTGISILVTFTAVNGVIIALLPPFERRATRFRDTWLVFLLGLGLTFVELAGTVALKSWMETLAGMVS